MNRTGRQEENDLIEYYNAIEREYKIINVDADRKPIWEQLKHLSGD